MRVFYSTNYDIIQQLESNIFTNMLITDGNTLRWYIPMIKYNSSPEIYYIKKPDPEGWGNIPYEQMMAGIDLEGILEDEFTSEWVRPSVDICPGCT
jgi:hypothetical protein